MAIGNALLAFSASGTLQSFLVPVTGSYVIEASGAQGGEGGGPGGKGARVCGTFDLKAGDRLQVIVGMRGTAGFSAHQPAGGGGGGSFVWLGSARGALADMPLLAAGGGGGGNGSVGIITLDADMGAGFGGRNGHGGSADAGEFHFSGGGGTGWLSGGVAGSAPTYCFGGTHWRGGTGADYCGNLGGSGGFGGGGGGAFLGYGSGGGGGFSGGGGGTQTGPGGGGGGSCNRGRQQANSPGVQEGDGSVSIIAVSAAIPQLAPAGDECEAAAAGDSLKVYGRFFGD